MKKRRNSFESQDAGGQVTRDVDFFRSHAVCFSFRNATSKPVDKLNKYPGAPSSKYRS